MARTQAELPTRGPHLHGPFGLQTSCRGRDILQSGVQRGRDTSFTCMPPSPVKLVQQPLLPFRKSGALLALVLL